jgi:hypothetical protein
MSDLIDEDIEITDETAESGDCLYVFTYVGIITCGSRVVKVYPKYLLSKKDDPTTEMKQELDIDLSSDDYINDPKYKYPDKNRTQKDVWRYFHRDEGGDTDSKKGLIKRLEKLGFYLDDFKDDQDKVKLLFLLYCFEVENNVQLVPFLSNPSIENVDDSFVGLETKNGELMSYLKRNIAKELPKGYAARVRDCLFI